MNNLDDPQPPAEPLVELILKLVAADHQRTLRQIQRLIYQPFHNRFQPDLFRILPDKEIVGDAQYYTLRQTYRLVGPLMAHYPKTGEFGNFGRSLGALERVTGPNLVIRKLEIIHLAPKLHQAEPTLLALVQMMKKEDIIVNWSQFVVDARFWNKRVFVSWYESLIRFRSRIREEQ